MKASFSLMRTAAERAFDSGNRLIDGRFEFNADEGSELLRLFSRIRGLDVGFK